MELISDIINELIDAERSLLSPLLKTKVLATRIKNKELLNWVNSELDGYAEDAILPKWREYNGNLIGNYSDGSFQYSDQPLATIGLPEGLQKMLQSMNLYQGVSSLEALPRDKPTGRLERPLTPEFAQLLAQNIQKMGNPFFHIFSAKCEVSIHIVTQCLGTIRSKLLDLMLKIDEEFGSIAQIEELRNKKEEIVTLMNQTIINEGDGNVINTGDNSKVKAKIKITKGDLEGLKKMLTDNGVESGDIVELAEIIDTEKPDENNGVFGRSINNWIQKMIGKTLDGTWQITTGAAGSLLAEGIKAYYGM